MGPKTQKKAVSRSTLDFEPYPDQYSLRVVTFYDGDDLKVKHYPIEEFKKPPDDEPSPGWKFRWFHCPLNNMDWADACLEEFIPHLDTYAKTWYRGLRPALSRTIETPLHSRHMEPSCKWTAPPSNCESVEKNEISKAEAKSTGERSEGPSVSKGERSEQQHSDRARRVQRVPSIGDARGSERLDVFPCISTYLPYMNWDSFGRYCALRRAYESRADEQRALDQGQSEERYQFEKPQKIFLQQENNPLHVRRTLDQYYYGSLTNTVVRDTDQTISKWTSVNDTQIGRDGKRRATDGSLLLMVDQLWCWVVDDKTILSFFPSHHANFDDHRFTDLYDSILDRVGETSTIWDLYSLIIEQTVCHLFNRENLKFQDLMETYRWVTSKKAASQTNYFQKFYHEQNSRDSMTRTEALDNHRELTLTLEVADILDELKMIRSLVEKQQQVVKDVASALSQFKSPKDDSTEKRPSGIDETQPNSDRTRPNETQPSKDETEIINVPVKGITGAGKHYLTSTGETFAWIFSEIDSVQSDAEYTHKMLLNLLGLKQAAASLAEAHAAGRQATASLDEARSAGQQSRAVMLFTVVTIIFLPLSFFTSFFGQNVREYTGDDKNPTLSDIWMPTAVAVSVIVIVLALLCAFLIFRAKILSFLKELWLCVLDWIKKSWHFTLDWIKKSWDFPWRCCLACRHPKTLVGRWKGRKQHHLHKSKQKANDNGGAQLEDLYEPRSTNLE